jgi:hypothetical protein
MAGWPSPEHEKDPTLSPLGERVARDGAFTGLRGSGEGEFSTAGPSIFMARNLV